jgi:hypothetical protein
VRVLVILAAEGTDERSATAVQLKAASLSAWTGRAIGIKDKVPGLREGPKVPRHGAVGKHLTAHTDVFAGEKEKVEAPSLSHQFDFTSPEVFLR